MQFLSSEGALSPFGTGVKQRRVIVVACILIVFGLLVAQFEARRALQWWSDRQTCRFFQAAEGIRNGMLQESFTMRRHLELALTNRPETPPPDGQTWLATIEHLHHALKALSDDLSPPYVDDSLPLAIQSKLEAWKLRDSKCCFTWELPASWQHESYERSQIILMALDELFRLMLVNVAGKNLGEGVSEERGKAVTKGSIAVRLSSVRDRNELTVQFALPDRWTPAPDTARELKYLRQAFCFLTFGECFYRRQPSGLIWYFRWRSSSCSAQASQSIANL